MSDVDLEALAEVARAATQGSWWDRSDEYGQTAPHYGEFGWSVPGCPAGETEDSQQGRADAAYIATFDPPTVLALIERVRVAEAKVAAAEALADEWDDFDHDAVTCPKYVCGDCTMINAIHDLRNALASETVL